LGDSRYFIIEFFLVTTLVDVLLCPAQAVDGVAATVIDVALLLPF
jgi:hypothetical protein